MRSASASAAASLARADASANAEVARTAARRPVEVRLMLFHLIFPVGDGVLAAEDGVEAAELVPRAGGAAGPETGSGGSWLGADDSVAASRTGAFPSKVSTG